MKKKEFMVDSGASMHMMSKSDFTNEEQWHTHELQAGHLCTIGRTLDCRDKSPKRCRCIIGRPRARYSKLTETVHGRTGRTRMWIIGQCW